MDEAFPQRRAKLLWEAQGPRWRAPGSSGTHGCSSGHQMPGAQWLLLCQHRGPSPVGSSLLPPSWHWVSQLGSSQLAPLPHVRASHECRCCSATKNGDTGYENTRSGEKGMFSSWWDISKHHIGGDGPGGQLELHHPPLLGGLARGLTRGESRASP